MRSSQLPLNKLDDLGIFELIANALAVSQPESKTLQRRELSGSDAPTKAPPRRRGLLERLDHWIWTLQQRDVEAYLAKSTDVYDLEARIRALERNVAYPYY